MKNILLTGATGFIGKAFTEKLLHEGWCVHAITRNSSAARFVLPQEVKVLAWNPEENGHLVLPPEDFHAVVHLAGESLAKWPWTARRKESLWRSRINSTRLLINAFREVARKPSVFISASGMGYYGDGGEREVRVGDPPGKDFLAHLAAAWEGEALKARELGINVVLPRFGMVLGSDGGVLPKMSLPFQWGLGAVLGDGNQYWNWIHRNDVVELLFQALENPAFHGPVHAVAGVPLTQRKFAGLLSQRLKRPLWWRVPVPCLRIALGEMADLFLHGQKAVPDPTLFLPKVISLEEALWMR
jgi:uncharacterized protein (TIGR01777 family)